LILRILAYFSSTKGSSSRRRTRIVRFRRWRWR